jgi:hypothetical protein
LFFVLAIALFVLQYKASDWPFGINEPFLISVFALVCVRDYLRNMFEIPGMT